MTDINSESIQYRLFKESFTLDGEEFGLKYSILILIISKPSSSRPNYKNVLLFIRKSDGEQLSELEKNTIIEQLNKINIQTKTRHIPFSLQTPVQYGPVNMKKIIVIPPNNHGIINVPVFYASLSMDSFITLCKAGLSMNTNSEFSVGWNAKAIAIKKTIESTLKKNNKNKLITFLQHNPQIQELKILLRTKSYEPVNDEKYDQENRSKELLNTKVLQFLFPLHPNSPIPAFTPLSINSHKSVSPNLPHGELVSESSNVPSNEIQIQEKIKLDYQKISSIQSQYKISKKNLIENIQKHKEQYVRVLKDMYTRYNQTKPEGFKEQSFEGDENDELTIYKNFIKIMVLKLNDPNLQYLLDHVLENDLTKDTFYVYFIISIMKSSTQHEDKGFEFDLNINKIDIHDPHLDDHIYFFGHYFNFFISHLHIHFPRKNSPNSQLNIDFIPNENNISIQYGNRPSINFFPFFNHFYKLILEDKKFILIYPELYMFLKNFLKDRNLHSNIRYFYLILQIFKIFHTQEYTSPSNTFFFLDVFSIPKINILEVYITNCTENITIKDIYKFIIQYFINPNLIYSNNNQIHSSITEYCEKISRNNQGVNYIQRFLEKSPERKDYGPFFNLMLTPELIKLSDLNTNTNNLRTTPIHLKNSQIMNYKMITLQYILITIQIFRTVENKSFQNFQSIIENTTKFGTFMDDFILKEEINKLDNHPLTKISFLYQKIYTILNRKYNQLDISLFFFLYLDWFKQDKKLFNQPNSTLFNKNRVNHTKEYVQEILNMIGPLLSNENQTKYIFNEKGNIHLDYHELRNNINMRLQTFKQNKSRLNTNRLTNEEVQQLSNNFKEFIGVKNMYTIDDLTRYLTHLNLKIHKLDEESYKVRSDIVRGEKTLIDGLKLKYLSKKELNTYKVLLTFELLNKLLEKMNGLFEKDKKSIFKNKQIKEYIDMIQTLIELKEKYNQMKKDLQTIINEEDSLKLKLSNRKLKRMKIQLRKDENIRKLQDMNLNEVNSFVFRLKKYKMMKKIQEMYKFLILNWGFDNILINQQPIRESLTESASVSTPLSTPVNRVQRSLFRGIF